MTGLLDKHIRQDPNLMNQSLMRLLQIIKMIYQVGSVLRKAHLHAPIQVSSFYNTSERVASLLVKITNQVIRSCKRFITENGSLTIWNQVRIHTVDGKV